MAEISILKAFVQEQRTLRAAQKELVKTNNMEKIIKNIRVMLQVQGFDKCWTLENDKVVAEESVFFEPIFKNAATLYSILARDDELIIFFIIPHDLKLNKEIANVVVAILAKVVSWMDLNNKKNKKSFVFRGVRFFSNITINSTAKTLIQLATEKKYIVYDELEVRPLDHSAIPDYEILDANKQKTVLNALAGTSKINHRKYKANLPKLYVGDRMIKYLDLVPGDLLYVVRHDVGTTAIAQQTGGYVVVTAGNVPHPPNKALNKADK